MLTRFDIAVGGVNKTAMSEDLDIPVVSSDEVQHFHTPSQDPSYLCRSRLVAALLSRHFDVRLPG